MADMLWVYLTLFAVNFFAVSNIIDKFVVSKYLRTPVIAVVFYGFIGLLSGLVIFIFRGVFFPHISLLFLLLLNGGIVAVSTISYYKALKTEEASRVMPVIYSSPLLVVLIAAVFLQEIFTPEKYLGILLLAGGAILISIRKGSKMRLGRALFYGLIAAGGYAVSYVLTKYLLDFADFWQVFAWSRMGAFAISLSVLYLYFSDFRKLRFKPVALMATSETLTVASIVASTAALSLAPASLVSSLMSTQPFFVLLYATLLSVYAPRILKEEISGQILLLKFIAIVMMSAGGYLIIYSR